MTRGVSITYVDVAPEAKENFIPTATDKKFNTLENLQKYNMQLYNYASPCEYYNTLLDGSATSFPSNSDTANIGLWSNQLSNDIGEFSPAAQLTLTSNGQYSSQGFTFTFDKFNNIYPDKLSIQWLRVTDEDTTDLGTKEFNPDNAFYFCENAVENFNEVIIKFYKLNMPKNRLKVEVIDFGYGTIFYSDELSSVKCIQEINPISTEIITNTMDFTLNSKSNMQYSFQSKQPLITHNNDILISSTFVKSSKRTGQYTWEIQSEDYLTIMSNVPFAGDLYNNKNAYDLLVEIFNTAKVPYEIDNSVKNKKISGLIPYTTCRDALTYIAFAIQYVVDTSNSQVVKVFSLNDEISQTIELDRILQGQNFEDTDIVTRVTLSVYKYTQSDETLDVYKAEDSGTGNNILVIFSEPLYDLTITNGSFVVDDSNNPKKGTNYAYINAQANCVLTGNKCGVVETQIYKDNPIVLASAKENIVSISGNTLINIDNANDVLQKCSDYYSTTRTTNLTIIDRRIISGGDYITYGTDKYGSFVYEGKIPYTVTYDKFTNVGDKITSKTEYLGNITGRIIKQTFSLNGNNINKETVLK